MVYSLAWITDSERIVSAAYWTAIICFIVAALLILLVILLRVSWLDEQRRKKRFIKKWRPLLEASAQGNIPRKFPFLYRADRLYFLEYWNYLQDTADVSRRDNLNKAARQLKMDNVAKKLLHSRYLWRQLLAITTLGHLREDSAWDDLLELSRSEDPVVSLTAARAIVQLRPTEAIGSIVPRIASHGGWAPARIASLLSDAGDGNVCGPLTEALSTAKNEQKVRLIHYVGVTNCPSAQQQVRQLLADHAQDKDIKGEESIITASLGILKDPADAPLVRPFLGHPNWHIRIHAINAIGRIGGEEDVKRLMILLKDEHWWVRYRSAQALANMPSFSVAGVERLLNEQPEPATQDILRHVLAEKRFA